MRAAFGLGSLLIACLILAWIWASHTQQVAHTAKQIQPQVAQMSGRNADLTPAADSITLSSVEKSDHTLSGLKVDSIIPACAFEDYYGLQVGDVVQQIGPQQVGQGTIDSVDSGKDFMVDALEHKYDLTIDRNGQTLHLPADKNAPGNPAATANPTANQTNAQNPSNPSASANQPATPANQKPAVAPPPPKNAAGATLDLLNKIGAQQKDQDQQ